MYSQVKFRPGVGTALESALQSRADQTTDVAFSQVAKRDLERLYALYRLSLPKFSEEEAMIIVNALNGASHVTPEMTHRLYVDVQEYLEESEAYRVPSVSESARTLLIRLKAFSRFECMAVYDAAERFWLGPYSYNAEETHQRLKDVGFIS